MERVQNLRGWVVGVGFGGGLCVFVWCGGGGVLELENPKKRGEIDNGGLLG